MRAWRNVLPIIVGLFVLLAMPGRGQEFDALLPQANESDTGFLTRLLQDSLSDRGRDVQIIGFRGALSSRATFDRMTIADDDGIWLIVTDAALQWNRSALFQRRIEVAEISAARVELLRPPVAPPSDEILPIPRFELPELPVSVTLGALDLREVILGPDVLGQALRAGVSGAASLAAGEGDVRLQLDRLDEIAGEILLEGAFSNATRILSVDLRMAEGPGGLAVSLLDVPDQPEAALTISGTGPVDNFRADITLATGGQPRLAGDFTLRTGQPGVAQDLRLDLSGDLRPLVAPEFRPFFGAESSLRTEARRFDDGRLSLDDLTIRTEMLALRGRVRLGADSLPELIDLSGEIRDQSGARVVLPLPGGQTSIEAADLHLGFDAFASEDWDLVIDLLGFDNGDIAVETLFVNGLGRVTAQGFGEDIRVIDALIDFSALGLSAADPGVAQALGRSVTGSASVIWREGLPLLLPGLLLEGQGYTIGGRARLEDGVIIGDGRAEFLDLSRLSTLAGRELGGAVTARVEGSFGPTRDLFRVEADLGGRNLTLDQAELDRLLAGDSRIAVAVQGVDDGIVLQRLEAQAQTLRADLTGQLRNNQVDLRGMLDFTDLGVLGGAFGGALQAQINVEGPLENERLRMDATARDLSFGLADLDRALRGQTRLRVDGQRDGLAFDLAELVLENPVLTAQATGRVDPGASDLQLAFGLTGLDRIRPGLGGQVRGTLSVQEDGTNRSLDLNATAQGLRAGNPQTDALLAGTQQVTARVRMEDTILTIEQAQLSGPNLQASISGQPGGAMQVDARLRDLGLLAPGINGPVSVAGSLRDNGSAFVLDLTGQGPAGLQVRANGSVGRDLRADLRASGTLDIALVNPRIEPRSVQGPATFDLALQGPLALQSVTGTAQVTGAQLVIPDQYIRVTDLSGEARLSGGRAIVDVRGRGATGGTMGLTGSIDLTPPLNADLRARADGLRIVNPQLFETRASADISITGPLTAGPFIAGQVTLDDTEIRIPRIGLVGRGFIPENLRHLNERSASRVTRERAGIYLGESHGRARVPARLDVRIDAPNRIFIRGRGLDAELGGSLRVTGTTGDIIPIGEFGLIRGRLDLLGNRFTLNEGFASLQGDLMPFVRLAASTQRGGVVARVALQGRADAPDIVFESVPELPQEEIVSLLLFGRGFENLTLLQAAQLASSLATLSGRGEGIVERLRRGVGLDDLDIRTSETGETSVIAGRYITERVYAEVEVEPQGRSEVAISIDLTPSLSARGRVDNRGRLGIGLFFERDY